MSRFRYLNVNPDKILVPDCTIRAITVLTGKTWEEVYDGICAEGKLMHNMPSSNAVWSSYLRNLGYIRTPLPDTCPYCYTVDDFCHEHQHGKYLLALHEHVVAVVDGYYKERDPNNILKPLRIFGLKDETPQPQSVLPVNALKFKMTKNLKQCRTR